MMLHRNSTWRSLWMVVALVMALVGTQALAAEAYPDRPVKLIVAYPPGGGTDTLARQVGLELGKELGQPVIIVSGRLVPLLLSTTERLPAIPDVPTAAEAGISDFVVGFWSGVLAPKGTPQPVIDRLGAAFLKVMRDRKISDQLVQQGAVVNPLNGRDFASYITRDRLLWEKIIGSTRISLEKDIGGKD